MGGVGSAVTFRRISIVCVALSVVAAAASGQTPGGTETTVADRVYNEEQATRGRFLLRAYRDLMVFGR